MALRRSVGATASRIADLAARLAKFGFLMPWISLGFGLWSAFGVVRHYEQARRVAWCLALTWLCVGALALVRRALAARPESVWRRRVEWCLTWATQSLGQEILFFVLPFWVRSTTWGSVNSWFTGMLLCLGATVLVDPVYRWFSRHTRLLVLHKSLVQFSALAFLFPVLAASHTLAALAWAGGASGAVASFGRKGSRPWRSVPAGALVGALLALVLSDWIAPVPLRISGSAVCSSVVGRNPSDTLGSVPRGMPIVVWTRIFAPSGLRDTVVHAWSRDGIGILRVPLVLQGTPGSGFRTWSSSRTASARPGRVEVEVLTRQGQLVGRTGFEVR